MVFTQCSVLNRGKPNVEENRSPVVWQKTERIELHLGREHPFWEFRANLHYLYRHNFNRGISCYPADKMYTNRSF